MQHTSIALSTSWVVDREESKQLEGDFESGPRDIGVGIPRLKCRIPPVSYSLSSQYPPLCSLGRLHAGKFGDDCGHQIQKDPGDV